MATELQLLILKFTQLSHEIAVELANEFSTKPATKSGLVVLDAQQPPVKVKNPKRVLAGQMNAAKRALRKAEEAEQAQRDAEIAELARMAEEILEESESDTE